MFGTLVHHLLSLLAFQIKSLFLAPTILSQFIGLPCGEKDELGLGNIALIQVRNAGSLDLEGGDGDAKG